MNTPATEPQTRTLRDPLEIIFRHKKKGILFFSAVVVTAVIFLAFAPSGSYTSVSKLIIHRGRESVFLDPTTTAGDTLPLFKEWESEINSELEILKSREMVLQIIEKLGPSVFLKERAPSGKLGWLRALLNPPRKFIQRGLNSLAKDSPSGQKSEQQQQIDKVIRIIEENLLIEAQPKSDIITITYSANTPELARQIVTDLISIYLQRRIDLQQDPGTLQFFSQQTELLLNELAENEASILAIKEEGGIVSLDDDRHALQAAIELVKAEQLQVQSSLAASRARVNTIRTLLTPKSTAEKNKKSAALIDIGGYKELQITLPQEEAAVSAWIAQENKINQQLSRLQTELAGINKLEPAIRRLEREYELLEDKYRRYETNKEQARINQELETRKSYNVSIVQHATMPIEANPSGKLLKLIASVFLGMLGAVAIAFGADYLDPALHTASDITGRLSPPPALIELPVMSDKELYSGLSPPAPEKGDSPRFMRFGGELNKAPAECFEELFFKILALRPPGKSGPLIMGIISSSAGEGVSIIAANLSAAFAQDDRFVNVLLLDASMKKPTEALAARMMSSPFAYQYIHGAGISAGSEDLPGGVDALMDHLDRAKEQERDVVVVDLPPVCQGGCAIRMAEALDSVLMVIEAGHSSWRTVQWAAGRLVDTNAQLAGYILNRRSLAMPGWLSRML